MTSAAVRSFAVANTSLMGTPFVEEGCCQSTEVETEPVGSQSCSGSLPW